MSNFTIIDYKNAIRTQYKAAIDRDVSGILSDPTPAQLRDFYLRLFEKGLSEIDEEILKLFLEAKENSSLKKAIENCNIGKLKPIINFLEGGNTENRARIEMAAILVDFRYRPFRKFKKEISEEELELINELRDTNFSTGLSEGAKNIEKEEIKDIKKETKEVETGILTVISKVSTINPPLTIKRKFLEIIQERLKPIIIATILVFSLIATVIYFAFFKNHCMQWSEDHYEVVDCSSRDNGNPNVILPLDESLLDFKKLKACDTTTCFMKNGEAFVWYGKIGDSVDFFNDNGNGRHPETNAALRPVTHYMFNKYLKGKPCK